MKAKSLLFPRLARSLAAAALLALMGLGGWHGYEALYSMPVKRVLFKGELAALSRSDLEALAQSVQGTSAASASLAAVHEAARRIRWVRQATVRRRFPDTLEITFEAHEVLARWDEGTLVSTRGEVFGADYERPLARFRGPEGSTPLMARAYRAVARELSSLSNPVVELRLSARGAWQVVLASGLVLELGRGDIHERIARFTAAWPQLDAQARESRHADLRYANGFALRRVAGSEPQGAFPSAARAAIGKAPPQRLPAAAQ